MDSLFIDAEKAYSEAIKARKNREEVLYKNMLEHLDDNIIKAVEAGKMSCIDDWSKFITRDFFDTNLVDRFLKSIIDANYDVEFYYNTPTSYNPCGIIVAWGKNREKEIDDVFKSNPDLCRGENNDIH